MEGSAGGLGRNDPKEGEKAADVNEEVMSFDTADQFVVHARRKLVQLREDVKQKDEKILMLEREILQLKDAAKVNDEKNGMMELEIDRLKADSVKIGMMELEIDRLKADCAKNGEEIQVVRNAIETLNRRMEFKNERILELEVKEEAALEKARDEALARDEAARVRAAAMSKFKKWGVFAVVSILVALATKKFRYMEKAKREEDAYAKEEARKKKVLSHLH